MHIWLILWAAVAASEATLYAFAEAAVFKHRFARITIAGVLAIIVIATSVALLGHDWHVWLAPTFIVPYRVVNIVRFMRYSLQPDRLTSVSLRAHAWLSGAQLVLLGLSWALLSQPVVNLAAWIAATQLVVALVLLRSAVQTWEYAKPASTPAHYSDRELPSVSVLVPARNETKQLQDCLESLVRSDYPKLEIIVLDDCSQNKHTPEIIRSFAQSGVRFIPGEVPSDHWVAKNFACEQLRKEASGDLLLFTSADTVFAPTTVRAMVEELLSDKKEMLSILPSRSPEDRLHVSFLEPMRYFWELCLPRRLFKRPPVLSTSWIIRADRLDRDGGFASVQQSVAPETHFARKAVIADGYSFVRSGQRLAVYSTKDQTTQYDTTIRVRYPQLHRRLELVAITSFFELVFLVGPFVGILLSFLLPHSLAFLLVWLAIAIAVQLMYYYVSVETRLNTPIAALLTAPLAIVIDIYMLHLSLIRYEFSNVNWRGRNVCIPVMQATRRQLRSSVTNP